MLIDDLEKQGDQLFSKRSQLDSLWQEIAEHFYPERADFTLNRNLGADFAAGLMSSYPQLIRRDLGNGFSSMLRPAGKHWFDMTAGEEENLSVEAQTWMEWATRVMRRAMYDRKSNFVRATKEGDHDFATFGNAALTVELGPNQDAMLYRSWHLRDVAWCEDATQQVDRIYHRWCPTALQLVQMFGDKVSRQTQESYKKDPYREIKTCRVAMRSEQFGDSKIRSPWVFAHFEREPKHILKVEPIMENPWIIPRWQTVSGSQYGYSPATVCGLPDARLLQAMTRVLLEAGEKFTNPPLIGVQEALRGDVRLAAGGITWVDAEYDERLGEVLRPLTQDKSGLGAGFSMQDGLQQTLREAFFLNKIEMPNQPGDMTAYEVSQRVSEYIRQALPLFEPMELDYNGALCETTFDIMMRNGAFGPIDKIPRELMGRDVSFKFQSPLQSAIDSEKAGQLQQARNMLGIVADIDPSSLHMLDARVALRDSLRGLSVPTKWTRSDEAIEGITQAQAEERDQERALQAIEQSASASKDIAQSRAANAQAEKEAA